MKLLYFFCEFMKTTEDEALLCIDIINIMDSCTSATLEKANKNDIMLNLGLASKSAEEADETPTPTRLIRNCEEVGLFQDLQNVNPFDEYFKKAVENKDYSLSTLTTQQLTDDSLHTPQIYPQPEEEITKLSSKPADKFELSLSIIDDTTKGSEDALIIINSDNGDPDRLDPSSSVIDDNTNESKDTLIIINSDGEDDQLNKLDTNGDNNTKENAKEKVKSALVLKVQGLKTVPLQQLQQPKKTRPIYRRKSDKSVPLNLTPDEYEKREANRWAQIRSRIKKKKEWSDMRFEIRELKAERHKLLNMNMILEEKVRRLEAQLNIGKPAESTEETVINNDDDIPVHVIQKHPHMQDANISVAPPIAIASQTTVPLVKRAEDIVKFIEEPTLQTTTIVNNHSEPIHIIEPTSQSATIVDNHLKPIHIINPHLSTVPPINGNHGNIEILEQSLIVSQNHSNSAVLFILPPQNSKNVAVHQKHSILKKDPINVTPRKLKKIKRPIVLVDSE